MNQVPKPLSILAYFATSFANFVDTSGKFSSGVVDTGGKKKLRGLGELIHEKKQKSKIS
jgi:hypothetical protein